MKDNQDQINQLLDKLDVLLKRQNDFSMEIHSLRIEINKLKSSVTGETLEKEETKAVNPITDTNFEVKKETVIADYQTAQQQEVKEPQKEPVKKSSKLPKVNLDLERFIGENLINKIGILITIIGVAIGAKYTIDNDLISPLTRIILGYLAGVGLLGFGIKSKKNYENYSAVLVSGAIAIMYFITYFAYTFYDLIPQTFAFALMVIFTAFSVIAAISYDKQVIAHIGLVGAYGVPFLLSNGPGNIRVLFSYMAIINVGVLIISFKKYWKPLYYSSFILTWIIYYSWYKESYQIDNHFGLAFTFLSIFFITFYIIFLAYKLLQKEKFEIFDIVFLLTNSFIFFGIGYEILDNHPKGQQLLGLFTLCNALVHFIVSMVIYKQKLTDKNLLYFVAGLVLVFITIAIPVQLDGNWVTLLWAGEAALLFWIGRTKNIAIYEGISYFLMILAFFSVAQGWANSYGKFYIRNLTPLLNIHFLTSLLFITAFGFVNFINQNKNYQSSLTSHKNFLKTVSFLIPSILVCATYFAFFLEIANFWNIQYTDSKVTNKSTYSYSYWNTDLIRFGIIWIINYSLLFVSIISFINIRKLKSHKMGLINWGLNILFITVFLTVGFFVLAGLQESYLEKILAEYYQRGVFNIGIRYVSYAFLAFVIFACYQYSRQDFIKRNLKKAFDFLLYFTILWVASFELVSWMNVADFQSYKLGLSILWGIYSLFLIVLGIWKNKKHVRIGAIVLFGITLFKLFFYDIAHLDTIPKTIVFVSLGVLLLIISFLYNKYTHFISDENED